MKFENRGKWFGESAKRVKEEDLTNDEELALDEEAEDDFSDLLAEDELDVADGDEMKQANEVRYIDPSNIDRYNKDEIEAVKDASGNTRYKRRAAATAAKPSTKQASTTNSFNAKQKVDKNPAPKDMSSEEIQKMTQNHTKLINDSILTKEGKNAVKDSFDKTGRVYVTFKNDYGDDIRAFWRKDDDGTIRREMFSHHKPISGNDYWSRDIEDDNEYYFNDIDEFIDEMSAELEYDENMKIYV